MGGTHPQELNHWARACHSASKCQAGMGQNDGSDLLVPPFTACAGHSPLQTLA